MIKGLVKILFLAKCWVLKKVAFGKKKNWHYYSTYYYFYRYLTKISNDIESFTSILTSGNSVSRKSRWKFCEPIICTISETICRINLTFSKNTIKFIKYTICIYNCYTRFISGYNPLTILIKCIQHKYRCSQCLWPVSLQKKKQIYICI